MSPDLLKSSTADGESFHWQLDLYSDDARIAKSQFINQRRKIMQSQIDQQARPDKAHKKVVQSLNSPLRLFQTEKGRNSTMSRCTDKQSRFLSHRNFKRSSARPQMSIKEIQKAALESDLQNIVMQSMNKEEQKQQSPAISFEEHTPPKIQCVRNLNYTFHPKIKSYQHQTRKSTRKQTAKSIEKYSSVNKNRYSLQLTSTNEPQYCNNPSIFECSYDRQKLSFSPHQPEIVSQNESQKRKDIQYESFKGMKQEFLKSFQLKQNKLRQIDFNVSRKQSLMKRLSQIEKDSVEIVKQKTKEVPVQIKPKLPIDAAAIQQVEKRDKKQQVLIVDGHYFIKNHEYQRNPDSRNSEVFIQNLIRGFEQSKLQDFKSFLKNDLYLRYGITEEQFPAFNPSTNKAYIEVQKADSLIRARQQRLDNLKTHMRNYQAVTSHITSKTQEALLKLKTSVKKITLIRVSHLLLKNKLKFKTLLKNDEQIRTIIQNDTQFKRLLMKALPETKYYLCKVLKEIDAKYKHRFENDLQLSKKKMQDLLGLQMITLVDQQKAKYEQQRRTVRRVSLLQIINIQGGISSVMSSSRSNAYKSEAIKKWRFLVQKHFLTGYEHSLNQFNAKDKVKSYIFCAKMADLNNTLNQVFRDQPNLYYKYRQINFCLFNKAALEKMQNIMGDRLIVTDNDKTKFNLFGNRQHGKNIDEILRHNVEQERFNNVSKQMREMSDNKKDHTLVSMQKFFKTCQEGKVLPIPKFFLIKENALHIAERKIELAQARAIKEYLEENQEVEFRQVHSLILDNCFMTDECLSTILQGVINQHQSEKSRYNLEKLVSSFNFIGPKSLEKLEVLMPSLNELSLIGVKNKMIEIGGLIDILTEKGHRLQKLKLTHINLSNVNHVHQIINLMQRRAKNLYSLDLSWCNLVPQSMFLIASHLEEHPYTYKYINLANNSLNFSPNHKLEQEFSLKFVEKFTNYIQKTDMLNHLDLSGLPFQRDHVVQMARELCQCHNLMGIHLNDIGITTDVHYFTEVLDIFGLSEIDMHKKTRDMQLLEETVEEMLSEPEDATKDEHKYVNQQYKLSTKLILKVFEEAYRQESQKQVDPQNTLQGREEQFAKKFYKEHLLNVMDNKLVSIRKMQQIANQTGIGRRGLSDVDNFVLTRKINNPELIWNQDSHKDNLPFCRYFQKDASEFWQLSIKHECYMCQGYRYTVIYFRKENLGNSNSGLMEVKDELFLQKLRKEYFSDPLNKKKLIPQIRGTVVEGQQLQFPFSRISFDRPLRMVSAKIFALMCVSQSTHFISTINQAEVIKSSVVKYLDIDEPRVLRRIGIMNRLKGWREILIDKTLNNELTDLHIINQESFNKNYMAKKISNSSPLNQKIDIDLVDSESSYSDQEDSEEISEQLFNAQNNLYVYAAYLPPGRHKFLIYCPESNRAFIKTEIIKQNTKDFFPEFPKQIYIKSDKKVIQNVWRSWVEDTSQSLAEVFTSDVNLPNFNLGILIKDAEELKKAKKHLLDNFHIIKRIFNSAILQSEHYPKLDYENSQLLINIAFNKQNGVDRIEQAAVDNAFIRATRNGSKKKLKGNLNRSEFIDFVARCATCEKSDKFPKMTPSDSIQFFIENYLKPQYEKFDDQQVRDLIRKRTQINELLFLNRLGLNWVFEKCKDPKLGFSFESAEKLFTPCIQKYEQEKEGKNRGQPEDKKTKLEKIDKVVIHDQCMRSMMTIKDEIKNSKKYSYLFYVEFLELLCRIALLMYKDQLWVLPEHKVHSLLELVWREFDIKNQKPSGDSKNFSMELIKVEQEKTKNVSSLKHNELPQQHKTHNLHQLNTQSY